MKTLLPLLALLSLSPARAGSPEKPAHVPYSPSHHAFSCELPAEWAVFEEETPRGTAVHALGPSEARGGYRAAIHVHYFEKERPGFVPWQESLAKIRERDKASGRESTSMSSWRVAKKPAKLFEIR